MFGVSPPPLGQALDSKVDLKKDFKETSSDQYKNDFEKTLKEKLAVKEKLNDASPPKELKIKKDDQEPKMAKEPVREKDRETDKEEKNSSGGTKKRMNETVDDPMISMIMASNESEVGIPESKTNDLALIEESQPTVQIQGAILGAMAFAPQPQAEVEMTGKAVVQMPPAHSAFSELNALNEVVVPAEAEVTAQTLSPELMQKLQALQPQSMAQPALPLQNLQQQTVQQQGLPPAKGVQATMPVSEGFGQDVAPQPKLASEVQQIRQSYDPLQVKPQSSEEGEELYIQPMIVPEQPVIEAMPTIDKAPSSAVGDILQKVQTPTVEIATLPQAQSVVEASAVLETKVPIVEAAAVVAAPMMASMFKADGGNKSDQSFDLEKDLSDEVGFEPEADASLPAAVKNDEKPVSLKSQEFQKSVYEQLQKMDQRPPTAALQSHIEQKGEQPVQSEDVASKGLKADAVNPNEVHHVGQTQSEFKAHVAQPTFAGSEQHRMQMLEKNHDKNIQEVMNQAQYLVKQGGGEMKVSMSPDGLAEVQLKVMLQNGKVNIEMQTHDKSVKKLMEDSLTELKSGLAAHNLSVEHVKINTVTATNTDNSAQFQSDWNQGGGEHQQREYWNQFQENLNQRQNFARRSNYGSGSNGSDGASASSMSASASTERVGATPRTYGGTKGSQINWVA